MGSGSLLKMTYMGHTTFQLETEEVSLLINPGIWDGEPVVPVDHDARIIVATNHADDALGNAIEIANNTVRVLVDEAEKDSELSAKEAEAARANLSETASDIKERVEGALSSESETLESRMERLLSDVSYKADDVISALEKKLAELKARNKKL